MKSSFQIGILCTVFCLGSTFFSSAVQTVNIGSTFSCTFLDSGEKGFFDSSSTHTWTSDQIDSAIRALNTWNTLINSTPGRTLNVGLTWYDGADSSTLASAYSPYYYYLSNKPQQVSTMAEAVWRDGSTRTTFPVNQPRRPVHRRKSRKWEYGIYPRGNFVSGRYGAYCL